MGSYEARHWENISMLPARNGVQKGLRMFIDMEVYEFVDFHMCSNGVKLRIGPSSEKLILGQGGIYLRPGKTLPHSGAFWSVGAHKGGK